MDETDKPVHPIVFKLRDALSVYERMLTEHSAQRDMLGKLPAERQEQESQRLAKDGERLLVLDNIVGGLLAASLETIRAENYQKDTSKG